MYINMSFVLLKMETTIVHFFIHTLGKFLEIALSQKFTDEFPFLRLLYSVMLRLNAIIPV